MICYAVIDTNILVSALLSDKDDAATVQVIKKIISGNIIPIYSYDIAHEYKIVLNRKKFKFSKENIDFLLNSIFHFGILFEPIFFNDFSLPDMKDLPFYLVASQNQDKNSFLVTGNIKHFPTEPFIVTPRQLINILNENSLTLNNLE